jgi:TonB-dependent receptor
MKNSSEIRSTSMSLRLGASCLALCTVMLSAPAFAQAAPADQPVSDEDEIIVQGIRGSLTTAQSIKKNSDVIVDSVSADDINALPDRSVTETLQRIPGVSIDRFSAGVDPDHFSVEGSGVTIRGLSYVRSEINGREAFSVNNNRGLSFADVPSELLYGVDVFKSPSADRIEGGISGVVNLRTRRPFDNKGLMVAGSIETTYSDFINKSAPGFSALISNRWETGIGEIGVLVSGVSTKLFTRSDKFQITGFLPRTLYANGNVISSPSTADQAPVSAGVNQVYSPTGAGFGSEQFERQRYGLSGALQWKSNDGKFEAIVQYLRSDARQGTTERTVEIASNINNDPSHAWCNAGSLQNQGGDAGPCVGGTRAVPGTTLTFDGDGIFTSGTITGPTGWRADQFNNGFGPGGRTPTYGLQASHINRAEESRAVTTDISANIRWNVSDNFSASFDYQHVDAKTDELSASIWNASYSDARLDLRGNGLPNVQFIAPQSCNSSPQAIASCNSQFAGGFITPRSQYPAATSGNYLDPASTYYYASMDHAETNSGKSDAFRADFSYELPENGWIKGIEFGGRYAKRDQVARYSTFNWGALSQQWGNGGPIWLDNAAIPSSNYEAVTYPNYFGGGAGLPTQGSGRLFYSGNGAQNYGAYTAFSTSVVNAWLRQGGVTPGTQTGGASGWVPLAQRPGVVAGTNFLPAEINPLIEKNKAAYVSVKLDHEFDNGMKLTGSFGLRYTKTDRESLGTIQTVKSNPDSLTGPSTGPGSNVVPSTYDCTPRAASGTNPIYIPPAICGVTTAAQRQQIRDFYSGSTVAASNKFSYDYWLPSVNLKMDAGGGLIFRAAFSKGIAPPDFGYVRSSFIPNQNNGLVDYAQFYPNQGVAVVRAGNPFLKPVTSNNYDITAEWYFNQQLGRLTLAGFYKEIKGVNVPGRYPTSLTNNGVTLPAVLETATNSPSTGKVKGIEVGYEQSYTFLPGFLSGLGMSANVTYLNSSGIEQGSLNQAYPNLASGGDANNVTATDISKLPLTGLSKWNVNIAPYYQKGPFEMRLAYSWRSKFLLTVQDVIFPYQPTYNNAAGYLDGSVSLVVNKNLKLGLQASNLLDTITKTSAVIDRDAKLTVPRSYFKSDRNYKIFARLTF